MAGFLAGAAANIHLVSTANYCVLAGCYFLVGFFDKEGRRRAGKDAALFLFFLVLGMAPILLKKYLTHETDIFVLMDPEWLSMVKLRSPHHWFPPYSRLIFQAVLGGMMFYFLRSSKTVCLNSPEKILRAYLAAFLAMIVGSVFATIFSSLYPVLIGLNLSFYRTDWFFVIMFYIVLACWLCSVLRRSKILLVSATLGFVYLGAKFQFLLLMGIGIWSLLNMRRIDGGEPDEKSVDRFGFKWLMLLIFAFLSSAIAVGHRPQFDNPMIDNTGVNIEVQKWLKENTAQTALVMAPPYEDDFRIFSERATVGSWKDWTYNVLDREFAFAMSERLKDACGIGVTVCQDAKQCLEVCRETYLSMDAERIRYLAAKYDFSHFVTENKNIPALAKRYENKKYAVYEVGGIR